MDIVLPFHFDTGGPVTGLAKFFAGLALVVLVPGLIKFTLLEPSVAAAFGVVVIGVMLGLVAWLLITQLAGAIGTVTRSEIVIEPRRVFGIASNNPQGRFALDLFNGVRVDRMAFSANRYSPHERVSLLGKNGTRSIVIAHTQRGAGVGLARRLGILLELPVSDALVPY